MSDVIEHVLIAIIRSLLKGWAYALMIKAGAWLDKKLPSQRTRVIVGMILGAIAFVLIPVIASLMQ
jgi:uncharacterized protein YacL